jgi:hypothetical protein
MQNLYLIRTAMIVTLAAGLLGIGWMGMQGDEAQIAPEMIAVSTSAEPAVYFPSLYVLQPNPEEPEVYEY